MAKKGTVDWARIKAEYITTNCSQADLAEKYDVNPKNIGVKCAKEGWVAQRRKYTEKAVAKSLTKTSSKEAKRLSKLMDASNKAIDVAMRALGDDQQFNRYIVSDGIGGGATETTEKVFEKVDTKALKDLASVIKDLTALMRDFYNIPTAAQAEAQRIAAERLEMDKRKADTDKQVDTKLELVGIPEEYKQ